MLKLLTKIATDILPSVVATVIGAYIVNHYITDRPAAPAAATSAADPQRADPQRVDPERVDPVALKADSTRAVREKAAAEGSAEVKPLDAKSSGPAEPADAVAPPHHPLTPHERRLAKASPTVDTATEDPRNAIELAKAAIERLRRTSEQEPPRPAAASGLQPLPPPITVKMPGSDPFSPRPGAAHADDPNRPTPPVDIPHPPDLRADVTAASSARDNASNLAEDMLSAARSMFHVVMPGQSKMPD